MGTYLSTPVTEKATEEGACLDCPYTPLAWGVVDMQGWRKSMEDAHVAQTALSIPQQHVHNQFRGASYDSLGEIDSDEDEDEDEEKEEGNNDDEKDDVDDDKPAVNQTAAPGSTLYPSKKKKTATSSQQQQGTPSSLASASSSLERQQQQQQSGLASLSSSSQQQQPLPHGTAKVFGVFDGHGGPEVARFCQLYFCSVLQRQVTWQNPSSISASYNANLDPAESDMGLALRATFHGLDTMIDDAQRRQEIIQLRAVKPMPGERRDVVVAATTTAPASTTDPPTPKAVAASEPPPPQQQKQQEEVVAKEQEDNTAVSKLAIPVGDADNAAGPTTTTMTTAEATATAAPVSAAAMTHANAAAAAAAAVPLEESASSSSKDGSEEGTKEDGGGEAAATASTVPVVVENLPADDAEKDEAAANPVEEDDDDDGDADSHEAAGREEAAKHDQDLMNDDDDNDLEELDHEVTATEANSSTLQQQQEQQQQPQEHEESPPTAAGKVSVMFQRLLNMSTSAVTGAATGSSSGGTPASNQSGAMVLHVATHPDGTSDTSTSTGMLAASSNPELGGVATSPQQPGSPSSPGATGAPGTATTTTPGTSTTLPTMVQNGRMICNLPDHPIHAGATAIVVVIVGKLCTVANAGDSRAVLCRGGTAFPLSADHKPLQDRELTRIKKAGGFVNQFGRVNGNLNLSRSIGDLKYKQVAGIPPAAQMITAEPDIVQLTLDEDTDEFVILGCDGIWDCLSNEKAVQFVRTRIHDMTPVQIGTAMLDEIISEDPRSTQGIGGDNMTVMIVDLKPQTRSYYQRQQHQQEGEATEPQRPASPETSTSSSEGGEGGNSTNNRPPAAVLRYGAGGDGIV